MAFAHQPPSQSAVQLKSILKRANDDEAAPVTGGNGSRGNRVKFVLGGEETNRGEQMMIGIRNNFNNNNASFADGDAPPTSVAMDLRAFKSFSLHPHCLFFPSLLNLQKPHLIIHATILK